MRKCVFFLAALLIFIFPFVHAADYSGHWAEPYIKEAMDKNLASGIGGGNFEPDRNISRAEFINLLINYTGLSSDSLFTSFNDINSDSWYFKSIASAEALNIAKGYSDGNFYPDAPLTRQDAVVFICRAYRIEPDKERVPLSFTDSSYISDYAKNYVTFAVRSQIISGYGDNTLKPQNNITRAESIALLKNVSKKSESFEKTPQFYEGYPKISPRGSVNNITVEIKTNTDCTIYYKVVKKTTSSSYLYPNKEEINQFLAKIPANETITSNIVLNSYDEEYNLFFIAVAEHGGKSDIIRIKDAKALAYSEGDGSADDPYLIFNESQLDYIRYCQNKHFKLANDITLTDEWEPIDAKDGYFASLDGDGHSINNLKINSLINNAGLFSELSGGIIKNLTISGEIYANSNAGLFAGKSENSIISNCAAIGKVTVLSNNAGGITGINNGIIENSVSAAELVKSVSNAGGITGSGRGSITNCLCAVSKVVSDIYAGGISGVNNSGKIKNCIAANLTVTDTITYNTGRITTNKESGYCENNYAYSKMSTDSINAAPSSENMNGADISWNDIISEEFFKDILMWDFENIWKMPDEDGVFILPLPKIFSDLKLNEGKTPYAPIKINSPEKLKNINPDYHYLLTQDITYNSFWFPPSSDYEFNGSFDGGGYTVSKIKIPYSDECENYSLFGKIKDGTVRNLSITGLTVDGKVNVSSIANENFGVIENVKVDGIFNSDSSLKSSMCGGIVSVNYGNIDNCDVKADIKLNTTSVTAGGIAGQNEGFLNNNSYSGNINITQSKNEISSSVGGITGFNNEGYIYNSFSNLNLTSDSCIIYAGGITGILNSGEIYKASSKGTIKTTAKDTDISSAYTGGICGLSESGLIFNCFSSADINTKSIKSYAGGISGYNTYANIQNTYAINKITQTGGSITDAENAVFAGGISGYNYQGFLAANVSINPWILSNGFIKNIASSKSQEYLSDNYTFQELKEGGISSENGVYVNLKEIKNNDFFFLPVYLNGKLGWPSVKYEDSEPVWTSSKIHNNLYPFPVLEGVKNQSEFIIPQELR